MVTQPRFNFSDEIIILNLVCLTSGCWNCDRRGEGRDGGSKSRSSLSDGAGGGGGHAIDNKR